MYHWIRCGGNGFMWPFAIGNSCQYDAHTHIQDRLRYAYLSFPLCTRITEGLGGKSLCLLPKTQKSSCQVNDDGNAPPQSSSNSEKSLLPAALNHIYKVSILFCTQKQLVTLWICNPYSPNAQLLLFSGAILTRMGVQPFPVGTLDILKDSGEPHLKIGATRG